MAVIHIIQPDQNNIESMVATTNNIIEISFVHPVLPSEGEEPSVEERGSTIDILYTNGEHRSLDCTTPTVFRIAEEDEIIVKTSDARQFEKAYLGLLSKGFVKSGEKEP